MRNTRALFIVLCIRALPVACKSPQAQSQDELRATDTDRHESKLRHDPIEDDPKYKLIFEKIDAEVRDALKNDPHRNHRGAVHIFWNTKKYLLKEKYGIDWKSPGEMNPHVIFD